MSWEYICQCSIDKCFISGCGFYLIIDLIFSYSSLNLSLTAAMNIPWGGGGVGLFENNQLLGESPLLNETMLVTNQPHCRANEKHHSGVNCDFN